MKVRVSPVQWSEPYSILTPLRIQTWAAGFKIISGDHYTTTAREGPPLTVKAFCIQNTESNSPMFASLRAIRSTYLYFVATISITQCTCVSMISINTFDGMLSFQTKKSYLGITVKCAIFSGFCAQKLHTFYQIVCLVFSDFFTFLAMDLDTPFENLGIFFCFFLSVLNVYVNCILE